VGSRFNVQKYDVIKTPIFCANPETVVLQLVNSYCKPHLLYAVESSEFSRAAMKKLQSAWVCALSKIFHVKDSDLEYASQLCNITPLEVEVAAIGRENFIESCVI